MTKNKITFSDVESYLQHAMFNATDPRLDGWSTFGYKQNIYRVKFLAEEMLAKCSTYTGEEEWLQEIKTERALKELGYNEQS